MPLVDVANPSDLDEQLFTTWFSAFGVPAYVLDEHGRFMPARGAVGSGPGAIVAPDLLERGYNAWYGAPGYYADAPGVDRVIPDQYIDNMYPGAIGVNPWDHIFGTFSGDPMDFTDRVHADDQPIQAGEYSLS